MDLRYFKLTLHAVLMMPVILLFSCSPAKYVPEGSYLLSRNKVESTQKSIPESQLKSYLVQKPNKKILGFRFHLFLYNLSNIEKDRWPHNWLRRIGEEPIVYNPAMTRTSAEQLSQLLENKGYYHAVIRDTVFFRRKNAKVSYTINPLEPYRVKRIEYHFEDTGLISQILPDTINSLVRRGMKFDKDVLQNERLRIESLLKEKGYFRFSKEYIYFNAAIDAQEYSVDLVMGFKEFVEGRPDPFTKIKHHHKYLIDKVFVYPDYGSAAGGVSRTASDIAYDTTLYQNLYFLNQGKPTLRPGVITNVNYINPGEYYRLSNVNRTYRNLSELGPIRYTNISFREKDSLSARNTDKLLDCRIELARKKVQSYQTEVAGTNSGGDLGVRGNLSYQNLNLLRGAEVFNIRFTGAIEALKNRSDQKFSSMKEVGAEISIIFPKFFAPLRMEGFVRRFSPKTTVASSFNYQSRPDYTRSIANGSYSYRWNGSQYLTHTLWPIEVSYVQIYENRSSAEFIDSIKNTPLGFSFEDHLVNAIRYGFELNNQSIGRRKDFGFLRFNVESAGNLVNAAKEVFHAESVNGQYQVFNVPYFQYLRSDIDLRYYNIIDKQNTFVYRLYIGLGYPYGNSRALPYERKFFSGGPNSIRAWSSRDLGPGSYVDTTTARKIFSYPNRNGDMKLEANIEYRFKVIWKMEAAIFLDAGNIWAIRPEDDKPGSLFKWNSFYRELALGTGFGARFDFSFFLLRLDFGLKVRDPAKPEADRWLPVFRDFGLNDLHLNFGIGYPF